MKKTTQWSEKDLAQLDAWEFARFGGKVASESGLQRFPRLVEELHPEVKSDLSSLKVRWSVFGEVNSAGHCVIGLEGSFPASVPCMRCNSPVSDHFEFKRLLRLCKSDQEADTIELDDEVDPVVASGKVNALEWLEDELMLSLPMFPSHEGCAPESASSGLVNEDPDVSEGQHQSSAVERPASVVNNLESAPETHRPFEILARLKKPGSV
ncbi:MAG: YceD family protein [Burkholderiales bacterium]|nr:YceD family protein [Burkholderiales bacterium]